MKLFSSCGSSIHGWHYIEKKALAEIKNIPPLSAHVSLSRKGMPSPGGFDINIRPKGPNTFLHAPRKLENCNSNSSMLVSFT
jgi:hypothetical protein